MNKLKAMMAFRRVAELGSFTDAASDLGLSNAGVSNYVSQLEKELGVTLLIRSTRHISLSEIGQSYLDKVQRILDCLEEAEDSVRGLQTKPHGRLHVNAPSTFGQLHVTSCIPAFARRYPDVKVDLSLSDRVVDLIEERVDIALRVSTGLPDSTLVARALAPIDRVVCAAPAYLELYGAPTSPEELAHHNCITYKLSDSSVDWPLGGKRYPVSGMVRADSSVAVRDLTVGGSGISLLPRFIAAPDIRAGRLVPLLEGHSPEAHTLYAVFPPAARPSIKVRLFLEHFLDHLGSPPRWEREAEGQSCRVASRGG